MRTRIISFHRGNLNPELLRMQKAVFDKFYIPLEQIETTLTHPEAIDHFLKTEEWDTIVLFDADCIPLTKTVVEETIKFVSNFKGGCVHGAVQKASHIENSRIYVGPCFMAFTKDTFIKIGSPSFLATHRGDVGEEMTYGCRNNDVKWFILTPSHVEVPLWDLANDIKFGYGTTYSNCIYHAFESNAKHESTGMFIEKCREVLGL